MTPLRKTEINMDQSDPSCLHCDASLRDHPLMARIATLEADLAKVTAQRNEYHEMTGTIDVHVG